jgi:hypothetical protein
MKTRKYFYFVCVPVIIAAVFAFTGCSSDAEEDLKGGVDEPGAWGPEFRREIYSIYSQQYNERNSVEVFLSFQGTFDGHTWQGIRNRIMSAFEIIFLRQNGWSIYESMDNIIIETFGVEILKGWGEGWGDEYSYKTAGTDDYFMVGNLNDFVATIIVERPEQIAKGEYYEYYKVTDRRHLYINHNQFDWLLAPLPPHVDSYEQRMLIKAIFALLNGVPEKY